MDVASAKGIIIINGRAYDAQQVMDALFGATYVDVKVDGTYLVIGNSRIQPVAKSIQELAMLRTCFGSLAYCCSQDKKCMDRDGALELLNLTIEDYHQIKSTCHQMFVDTSKKIVDSSSLKNRLLTYQTTRQTGEDQTIDQTNQRKVDTSSYYWRSKSFAGSEDTSDTSSLEDKSYGPADLSLIFGDPTRKDNVSSPSDEDTREKTASNWIHPSSMPPRLGGRGDGRETRWDSADRCVHCRAQIPLGARYCPNCGESIY
nr:zinc-ribbon domain-containing protein [Candidatus Njordarchaeota archaeon]